MWPLAGIITRCHGNCWQLAVTVVMGTAWQTHKERELGEEDVREVNGSITKEEPADVFKRHVKSTWYCSWAGLSLTPPFWRSDKQNQTSFVTWADCIAWCFCWGINKKGCQRGRLVFYILAHALRITPRSLHPSFSCHVSSPLPFLHSWLPSTSLKGF